MSKEILSTNYSFTICWYIFTHTHTHIHIYIYIYIYVCVSVCKYIFIYCKLCLIMFPLVFVYGYTTIHETFGLSGKMELLVSHSNIWNHFTVSK